MWLVYQRNHNGFQGISSCTHLSVHTGYSGSFMVYNRSLIDSEMFILSAYSYGWCNDWLGFGHSVILKDEWDLSHIVHQGTLCTSLELYNSFNPIDVVGLLLGWLRT